MTRTITTRTTCTSEHISTPCVVFLVFITCHTTLAQVVLESVILTPCHTCVVVLDSLRPLFLLPPALHRPFSFSHFSCTLTCTSTSTIELGRSEEVILEMDRLANEDYTHIATEEEIDVHRGNWWIRSNFVDSDRMPITHRLHFKKALSTLHRLKKAEDKAYYENWSQNSSSWWQWQTSWWHPYYETSPQRWT